MNIFKDLKDQLSEFTLSNSLYLLQFVNSLYLIAKWTMFNNQSQNNPDVGKSKTGFGNNPNLFSLFRREQNKSKADEESATEVPKNIKG